MMQFVKHPKLTNSEKDFLALLYLMYGKMLWYVSVKILKDRDLAEDAMQQSFEKIIKKAALLWSFEDMEKVRQYMYVVARNTALVMLRHSGRFCFLMSYSLNQRHPLTR